MHKRTLYVACLMLYSMPVMAASAAPDSHLTKSTKIALSPEAKVSQTKSCFQDYVAKYMMNPVVPRPSDSTPKVLAKMGTWVLSPIWLLPFICAAVTADMITFCGAKDSE